MSEDPEVDLDELFTLSVSMVRCECGSIVKTDMPLVCRCGKRFLYWRDIEGKIKRLDQMDLGHLSNCVRMVAAKAEQYPPELRGAFEAALDIFYAEIGSRDKEVAQLTGIQAALERSLKSC